jgi:hypothetical protein
MNSINHPHSTGPFIPGSRTIFPFTPKLSQAREKSVGASASWRKFLFFHEMNMGYVDMDAHKHGFSSHSHAIIFIGIMYADEWQWHVSLGTISKKKKYSFSHTSITAKTSNHSLSSHDLKSYTKTIFYPARQTYICLRRNLVISQKQIMLKA